MSRTDLVTSYLALSSSVFEWSREYVPDIPEVNKHGVLQLFSLILPLAFVFIHQWLNDVQSRSNNSLVAAAAPAPSHHLQSAGGVEAVYSQASFPTAPEPSNFRPNPQTSMQELRAFGTPSTALLAAPVPPRTPAAAIAMAPAPVRLSTPAPDSPGTDVSDLTQNTGFRSSAGGGGGPLSVATGGLRSLASQDTVTRHSKHWWKLKNFRDWCLEGFTLYEDRGDQYKTLSSRLVKRSLIVEYSTKTGTEKCFLKWKKVDMISKVMNFLRVSTKWQVDTDVVEIYKIKVPLKMETKDFFGFRIAWGGTDQTTAMATAKQKMIDVYVDDMNKRNMFLHYFEEVVIKLDWKDFFDRKSSTTKSSLQSKFSSEKLETLDE